MGAASSERSRARAGWNVLGVCTALYFIGLLGLLAAIEWYGERLWLLSLCLYAPPQLFLAPLVVLSPLCLIWRRSLLKWHLLCGIIVGFIYMTFRWTPEGAAGPEALTVMTHNIGEGDAEQFARFLEQENPDFVLLQDAGALRAQLAANSRWTIGRAGNFRLLSRHPIQSSAIVALPNWRGRAVAARFEVLFQGRPLALYSVHLPTPRAQLSRFLQRDLIGELFVEQDLAVFENYEEWIAARLALAEDVANVIRQETRPSIVGGDFNIPDHGAVYHLFAGEMTDAFARRGRGWGMTFPGGNRNRLSRYIGPWLRLDFLFANRGWEPISCGVEVGQNAQHRAVVARFNPAR